MKNQTGQDNIIIMKNFVEKLKQEKSALLKTFIITMLFFGVNVYFSLTSDTYFTFKSGFSAAARDMILRNGRPVIGIIYELHFLSGLSNESFYYISSILALLFLAASIWLYYKMLVKHEVGENAGILVSFASIANIFVIEYFMFVEKCGFMLAVLFNVAAVYFIEKFFEEKKIRHTVATLIFMCLAIFTYQGTIALFVILSLPFAFKYAKTFKEYAMNIVSIGVCYLLPVLAGLFAFKFIFKSTRLSGAVDWLANAKNVFYGLKEYGKSTFDILPKFVFLILAFLVFSAAILLALGHKHKGMCILNIFMIALASAVFPTATILQGSGWWVTRTVYPIASVVGAFATHLLINSIDPDKQDKGAELIRRFSVLVIGALLTFQYFSFNRIFIDKYELNALDEYRYEYVGQAINDYQQSTGIKITKISFYSDANRTYPAYSNLHPQGDYMVSAFYTAWSDIYALNYYLGSDYEKVDPLDKYTEYFASRDWNQLSQNQLIFEGDTLHLCVY